MSVDAKIIGALSSLGYPPQADVYGGTATTYIVFSYNTAPVAFGDNAPTHERYMVTVHFLCPLTTDAVTIRQSIKTLLFAAGFTWPDEINLSDEDGQDYAFECEITEAV